MPGGGKSESMRVIVRVRPENSRECKTSADSNDVPLISVLDEQVRHSLEPHYALIYRLHNLKLL